MVAGALHGLSVGRLVPTRGRPSSSFSPHPHPANITVTVSKNNTHSRLGQSPCRLQRWHLFVVHPFQIQSDQVAMILLSAFVSGGLGVDLSRNLTEVVNRLCKLQPPIAGPVTTDDRRKGRDWIRS